MSKVKVEEAEIVVHGTVDKPYFEIKYREVGKKDYNVGYSSYDVRKVFGWLESELVLSQGKIQGVFLAAFELDGIGGFPCVGLVANRYFHSEGACCYVLRNEDSLVGGGTLSGTV